MIREPLLVTEAGSLGAAFLPFLVDEGVGLAVGLALLAASHSAEPTIALVVNKMTQKKWGGCHTCLVVLA